MDISSALGAQQGLFRQALSLSVIKQGAESQQAAVEIISQAAEAISSCSSCSERGTNLDVLV